MAICARSFELVKDRLNLIDFHGPVAVSCDDTKLLPSWRICWSQERNSHILVGGIHGAVDVLDPDVMDQFIAENLALCATKVSFSLMIIALYMY